MIQIKRAQTGSFTNASTENKTAKTLVDRQIGYERAGQRLVYNDGGTLVPFPSTATITVNGILKGDGTGNISAAISGTDIKTINNASILGTGDIALEPAIAAGSAGYYWDGTKSWVPLPTIPAAPNNGILTISPTATDNTSTATFTANQSGNTTIGLGLGTMAYAATGDYWKKASSYSTMDTTAGYLGTYTSSNQYSGVWTGAGGFAADSINGSYHAFITGQTTSANA